MSSEQKIWIWVAAVVLGLGASGARAQQVAQPAENTFLMNAAMGGEAEVALATLAQRRSADPKVKALAERIAADHKKANAELRAIIATKRITVPGGPDKEHQTMQTTLAALQGSKFDEAYTAAMIDDHTKDIKEFEMAAKSGDPAVKAFAEKTLPSLREHLKMAQDAKAGAGMPPPVSRTGGGAGVPAGATPSSR
jgi:putative membrane protein